jgi:CelD/BcsL family acetyltransferase involved in cellulose biosynthesis
LSSAPAGPIEVEVVQSDSAFASLAAEWEALQAQAARTSIFESFDWQHLWWRTYGLGRSLKVLVARSGGAPVGLLALHIESVPIMRFPVRHLRFVGTGGDTYPDDLGPILAPGREAEIARALAAAVVRLSGWDILMLSDMNPDCPFTAAVAAAARGAGFACETGQSERIAFTNLPATWDAFLQSLHRDRRYRVRNIRKKLIAAHPAARFFVWDDPQTLDQGFERLVHLHQKRWRSIGKAHAFSTAEYRKFHRAVMGACLARDRLRLYCLELAPGDVTAMYYFYKFRKTVYLMQSGFDPDHADVKPGQVLLGHIIEHAISEGHEVLDFLKGDHRYKDELSTGERETSYVTAFRLNPGGVVYRLRRQVLPALMARARQLAERVRPRPAAEEHRP